nr:hypothetical protein PanWU01x14_270530 [Ipomoea batatas]
MVNPPGTKKKLSCWLVEHDRLPPLDRHDFEENEISPPSVLSSSLPERCLGLENGVKNCSTGCSSTNLVKVITTLTVGTTDMGPTDSVLQQKGNAQGRESSVKPKRVRACASKEGIKSKQNGKSKDSDNGSNSSVFNGKCSVSQIDGFRFFTNSFSFVCGAGATGIAVDLRRGSGIMSTLFRETLMNSRSSRTKLLWRLCRLAESTETLNRGFSATRNPSSASSSISKSNDLVRIRRGDFANEWNNGALEMEGNLHIEVAHSPEAGNEAGETPAPLEPGGEVVVLHERRDNVRTPPHNGLLERVPTSRVLERNIRSGISKCSDSESIVEADSQMQRRLTIRIVPSV